MGDTGKGKPKEDLNKIKEDLVCAGCGRPLVGKHQRCDACGNHYHLNCTKLSKVYRGKELVAMCQPCLAAVNSPVGMRTRRGTGSANSSRPNSPALGPLDLGNAATGLPLGPLAAALGAPATPSPVDGSVPEPSNAAIFARLVEMDNRNKEFVKTMEEKVDAVQRDIAAARVIIDTLPGSNSRVDAVETGLEKVVAEQLALRQDLESIRSANGSGGPAVAEGRFSSVEVTVKELAASLARINAERAQMSADCIIAGMPFAEGADLKRVSLAVLQAVLPTVESSNVVEVRALRPSTNRPSSGEPVSSSSVTPASARKDTPSPLIVKLSSSRLVQEVVRAKARHGKLHTSQLSGDLLAASGVALPLQSALINANEFLPPDLYNLRRTVRDAARKKGYSTFIKEGEVYIRKNKEDTAVRISSPADLKNFLSDQ